MLLRKPDGIRAPKSVHFGFVRPGSTQKRTIVVSGAEPHSLQVLSATTQSGQYRVQVEGGGEPNTSFRVAISFEPDGLEAEVQDSLQITTDYPNNPQLTIHLSGLSELRSSPTSTLSSSSAAPPES